MKISRMITAGFGLAAAGLLVAAPALADVVRLDGTKVSGDEVGTRFSISFDVNYSVFFDEERGGYTGNLPTYWDETGDTVSSYISLRNGTIISGFLVGFFDGGYEGDISIKVLLDRSIVNYNRYITEKLFIDPEWYINYYEYKWSGRIDTVYFNNENVTGTWKYYNALPEPGSWALLIAGFGLVGTAVRRRKTALAS